MKQIFLKTTFAILSAIIFYGCSQEPYDWSKEKTTVIEVAETTFPIVEKNSFTAETHIESSGKKIKEVKYCLYDFTWETIENKKGVPIKNKEGYYTCEFTNLAFSTTYHIEVIVYSSSSEEPVYSSVITVTTANDYVLKTGDAKNITHTSANISGEFYSETVSPSDINLGVIYSENEDLKGLIYTSNSTSIDGNSFTVELTELKIATKYFYCTYIEQSDGNIFYGDKKDFTTSIPNGTVDLGLSVLWAECNLGANSPEETGNYYAWGELNPKDTYTFDSYLYCNDGLSYDMDWWNYSYWEGLGTYGINIQLTNEYDAAKAQLGDFWGIPSINYVNELIENCDMELTTFKGINGIKFTSKKNGNSIFLPAAGYKDDEPSKATKSTIIEQGTNGYYWSGTGSSNSASDAMSLKLYDGNSEQKREIRYKGLTIRPIYYTFLNNPQ